MLVNDIFKKYPDTFTVFIKYGIEACCPLDTLEVESKKRNINLDQILEELNIKAR